MKKIRNALTIIMLIILCLTLTGCENKEKAFGEKYKMNLSDKDNEFEIPVYFFSEDEEQNEIEIEGLEFLENTMKYKLVNWSISDSNENGNVTISYTCRATGEVDFKVPVTNTKKWFYTFSIGNPFAFDYYTGEIYRENRSTEKGETNNKSRIMENGIEEKSDNEMAYTEINFNKDTTKVGVMSKLDFKGYSQVKYLGKEGEYYHYKGPIETDYTSYITVPKDYDGVMIALRKKGTNKEENAKEKEKYDRLVELQKQAKKTGEKSEELVSLENENDRILKLIDPDDENRKDIKIDEYYIIKIADIFNIQSKKQETNYIPIVIVIIVLLLSGTVAIILIIKKKEKKENRRTKRPLNK